MKNSNKNSFLSNLRSLFFEKNRHIEHSDSSTMTMVEDFTFDCVYSVITMDSSNDYVRLKSRLQNDMRLMSISSSESITSMESQDNVCCICLDEIKKSNLLMMSECHHKFHIKCVKEWLCQRPTCPLCNSDQHKLHERLSK